MKQADVVVVGGGPAGTAAAMHLVSRGHRVILYEGEVYPRDKACGEFVNDAALRHLDRLGVRLPESSPIHRASLSTARDSVTTDLDEPGVSVRRTHLDHQMALRAVDLGVELCEGHRVRGVQGNEIFGDGFRCEARVIVAADGTHSLLARQARLVVPVARLDRIGFSAHVRPDREVPSGEVHMFAGFGRTSTAGGFSMQGDGTGILSCVLPKSQANMLAGRLHEFASDLMKEWLGMNGEILDAQSTHCFGHKLRQVFTENTLFVGDAARFVDPFTGEGIHHALVGAELAAEVASDALHQGEISIRTLSRYDTMRRELDARYRLSDLVQSVVHSDGLVRRVSSRLKERPASAKKLFATLTDSKPPHAVMNPKTLWEVFGL